jgi:hypothetical protein
MDRWVVGWMFRLDGWVDARWFFLFPGRDHLSSLIRRKARIKMSCLILPKCTDKQQRQLMEYPHLCIGRTTMQHTVREQQEK